MWNWRCGDVYPTQWIFARAFGAVERHHLRSTGHGAPRPVRAFWNAESESNQRSITILFHSLSFSIDFGLNCSNDLSKNSKKIQKNPSGIHLDWANWCIKVVSWLIRLLMVATTEMIRQEQFRPDYLREQQVKLLQLKAARAVLANHDFLRLILTNPVPASVPPTQPHPQATEQPSVDPGLVFTIIFHPFTFLIGSFSLVLTGFLKKVIPSH